jgi:16S rRNA G966 N2-methylase RsmD
VATRICKPVENYYSRRMAKKAAAQNGRADLPVSQDAQQRVPATKLKSSSLLDMRVVYCGDNLEQLAKLPDACVDLIYIDPPFNSNRNYEVFWGKTKEKRAFEDRHESTRASCKGSSAADSAQT